ncbi:ABC transporter substrate-binding protein [Nocardiopsis sp. MG754419]|uniref:ABC transporter substrate-binding protein n=1 Tax=Nocardiopsis sp. MG754419 TaxID=2259865 RepID=UPI001BA8AF2A|nr:ABC transporter substrate-binding protein [Nocardiopsis sp. MG754419]MBR8744730.1 myristoyl transferase [Nocardiopsis sp. MG754419]
MKHTPVHPVGTTALVLSIALATACATSGAEGDPASGPAVIDDERCAANREAGTLTYVTGYEYQASVSILEAVAADALGYFEELCLDVVIEPGTGDTMANARRVHEGEARFTSFGNEAEVLQAHARGHDVLGIATYGHVPIATLLTPTDVTDLTDLEGAVLGHKGMLPAPLEAMLTRADVDLDSIRMELVGYDPAVLPDGEVDALTGFRSNEPLRLDRAGAEFLEWHPEDFGVGGSFGVMATDPEFAAEHPTAVEDYLRALSLAFEHCQEQGPACVDRAAALSGEDYDTAHHLEVWDAERELVTSFTPEGVPRGFIDLTLTEAEALTLVDNGELETLPDLEGLFDPAFLESVHVAGEVLWSDEGPTTAEQE